jgi:hypothetical protein
MTNIVIEIARQHLSIVNSINNVRQFDFDERHNILSLTPYQLVRDRYVSLHKICH